MTPRNSAHPFASLRPAALVAAILCALLPSLAHARHPAVNAAALVQVDRSGAVTISLRHDALAYALNETPGLITDQAMFALLNGPRQDRVDIFAEGRERMAAALQLKADGRPIPITITRAPTAEDVDAWKRENPAGILPVKLEFIAQASFPLAAADFTITFPEVLGDVVLSVERPASEPVYLPLRPGETSPAFELNLNENSKPAPPSPSLSIPAVLARYTMLGFTHIIPEGPDHALFVLGLFLLSPRFKTVLWQITAFTVAHTVTLTLTTLNIVSLPSSIVEPTLALTIAFIGIENLLTKKVHAWRPVVAFIFGLVHGMGFASALREVGLPTGQLATGLAGFSIGVELGHVAVLSAAFLLLGWWRDRAWYRARITIPLSLIIAAIALYWTYDRLS